MDAAERQIDHAELRTQLAPYRRASHAASLWQLASTFAIWAGLWTAMVLTLGVAWWLTIVLALPTALATIRLFILQHDCGHGSFFRKAKYNHWVGSVIGVLTMTPYHCWRREHALHHATSGNLDQRGIGDINTLTIREFYALSPWQRLAYRVYRHPLVLFGLGSFFHFAIRQRFSHDLPKDWRKERISVHGTNIALFSLLGGLTWLFGWQFFVLAYLPVLFFSASIGVWLFYVQHQFNPTYWEHEDNWDRHEAAVEGSSFYQLPRVLHWITANIGYHHVHHLDSRIPNYRLHHVHAEHESLRGADRLTLWSSFACINLKLWDEQRKRMVSFRKARQLQQAN